MKSSGIDGGRFSRGFLHKTNRGISVQLQPTTRGHGAGGGMFHNPMSVMPEPGPNTDTPISALRVSAGSRPPLRYDAISMSPRLVAALRLFLDRCSPACFLELPTDDLSIGSWVHPRPKLLIRA